MDNLSICVLAHHCNFYTSVIKKVRKDCMSCSHLFHCRQVQCVERVHGGKVWGQGSVYSGIATCESPRTQIGVYSPSPRSQNLWPHGMCVADYAAHSPIPNSTVLYITKWGLPSASDPRAKNMGQHATKGTVLTSQSLSPWCDCRHLGSTLGSWRWQGINVRNPLWRRTLLKQAITLIAESV